MIVINQYYSPDAPKALIDEQTLVDALRLLLKDKEAAFQVAKDTNYAAPENPHGFRPEDFSIPQITAVLKYLED